MVAYHPQQSACHLHRKPTVVELEHKDLHHACRLASVRGNRDDCDPDDSGVDSGGDKVQKEEGRGDTTAG